MRDGNWSPEEAAGVRSLVEAIIQALNAPEWDPGLRPVLAQWQDTLAGLGLSLGETVVGGAGRGGPSSTTVGGVSAVESVRKRKDRGLAEARRLIEELHGNRGAEVGRGHEDQPRGEAHDEGETTAHASS